MAERESPFDHVETSAATQLVTAFPTLTKRQERAMLAFLYRASARGYDDEATDSSVWDWGVRPWPTMANLRDKGLIEDAGWWGPEDGHLYKLTDLGHAYMTSVVAKRAAA